MACVNNHVYSCNPCNCVFSDSRLHYAARDNNVVALRALIASGMLVDCWGQDRVTPLMIAVQNDCKDTTRALLEAGANVNFTNSNGESALSMALYCNIDYKVVEAVILRTKAEAPTTEDLFLKLFSLRCCFPYAVLAKDAHVLTNFLQHGSDINSRNCIGRTALHFAALVDDIELATLLINNGADVNAQDNYRIVPLYFAMNRKNRSMVQLLLDHKANANPVGCTYPDQFPLFIGMVVGRAHENERVRECVELLLQNGAYPHRPSIFLSELCEHSNVSENSRINWLLAHMVMFDMLGSFGIEKYEEDELFEELPQLKEYYDHCRLVLGIEVVEKVLLLDLLGGYNEPTMRFLVRDRTFVSRVEYFCELRLDIKKYFSYYINTMIKRIAKASRVLELENPAILVLCDILNSNYHQYYLFAKKLVTYLDDQDLENLSEM